MKDTFLYALFKIKEAIFEWSKRKRNDRREEFTKYQ